MFDWHFPSVSVVKNPPAMLEMRFRPLGQEDPLGEWLPILVFLPGESNEWQPGRLQSIGLQRIRHDRSDNMHSHTIMFSLQVTFHHCLLHQVSLLDHLY